MLVIGLFWIALSAPTHSYPWVFWGFLCFGFAMLSAIIATVDNRHLKHVLALTPTDTGINLQQVHLLAAGKNTLGQLTAHQAIALKQVATQIYTHAFSDAMLAMGIVAIIILVLTVLFIPKKKRWINDVNQYPYC